MKPRKTPEEMAQLAYLKRERMCQIQHIREQANYDEFVAEHYDQVSLSELVEVWVPA